MKQSRKKMLPIGIEDFEKLRTNDFYYVDKTGLITELLEEQSEVTLYTRPRRFGKSLNMSMLEAFFSPESDKRVFDGLGIISNKELCDEYMGRYPVIHVSLKSINAPVFNTARAMAVRLVRRAALRYEAVLAGSTKLSETDRQDYNELLNVNMPEQVLYESLRTLSGLLEKHYGRKTVILVDEYDVPLAKAYDQGYYDQLVILIRNLFENTLKSNSSLKLAVLTGCMRLSKESIFTGMNNLRVLGITDPRADEYFGFTNLEVRELLTYYGISDMYETVHEWYDGYLFGNANVYCPWDVINYCSLAMHDPEAPPENYWANSSGNSIVRRFVEYSGNTVIKDEIEKLVNGGIVEKNIRQDLTYQDMYTSIDNIWSVLFTTGYLTSREKARGRLIKLVVPNKEVLSIYNDQILELFNENIRRDSETLRRFCDALARGDAAEAEECFNDYLEQTISIRDTYVKDGRKESFYHGLLLGILGLKDSWAVTSNEEAGTGYSDITIRDTSERLGIVIEVKYAGDGRLDTAAERALKQIEERHYADSLYKSRRIERVLKYGIACCRKECRVAVG